VELSLHEIGVKGLESVTWEQFFCPKRMLSQWNLLLCGMLYVCPQLVKWKTKKGKCCNPFPVFLYAFSVLCTKFRPSDLIIPILNLALCSLPLWESEAIPEIFWSCTKVMQKEKNAPSNKIIPCGLLHCAVIYMSDLK